MEDGRDRHGRRVAGLVAASDATCRPGLSTRGRLRALCDIAIEAVAGHRATVLVAQEGGGFQVEHRIGPELEPGGVGSELDLLSEPALVERLRGRRPVLLTEGDGPSGRGALLLAPITLEGELWGCLCVEAEPGGTQLADDLTGDTLAGLANMAAHVLLAERLRADRAELLSRHLSTEQRNRRRIANRLHDGPQQILVSLRMRLQMIQQDASDHSAEEIGLLAGYVEAARDDVRGLIVDLDTMTANTVLSHALRSLLETNAAVAGWRTTFEAGPGVDEVSEETRLTVERVVQEALANIRQHAGASAVALRVHRDDDTMAVVVADDGVGIPSDVPTTSTGEGGIPSMHELIWLIGGSLHIDSGPGMGTRIVVTAPRHA